MSTVQEVMYNHAIRYFHHQIITVVPHNLSLSNMFCLETRKSSWPAQGERKWRGGRGLLPPWDGRKVQFSSPTLGSGLPCPSICTLRRDPWGSEASRALHRHRGGPNLKNAPALTQGRDSALTHSDGQSTEKRNRGVGGGSGPGGLQEKLSSPPPACCSGLPCPSTLYTPP